MLKASLRRIWQRVTGSAIDDDLEPYAGRLAAAADAEARLRSMSQTQLEVEARRCLAELRASTDHRARIARADPLFAAVREAGRRLLGVRLFDEQVIAGTALAQGRVVEMQTGEGKTLAAVAAVMLFAAAGQGVHVWTFNDYLAQRDARWMAPIYRLFGLRAAWVTQDLTSAARREAYQADVTYSSAKEIGFDLLRDQLVTATSERVMRRLHAVLVDEADSLLIDEARTPLVLAGGDEAVDLGLGRLLPLVEALQRGLHVDTDEHERNVYLTDAGITRLEAELGRGCLHEQQNLQLLTAVNLALHAIFLLRRDVDYIVRRGGVELVDDRTGRVAERRRWPHGLQTALEVKEGITPRAEGRVLASITVQHLCRLYAHRAGMTGTARACAEELRDCYGMTTLVLPSHRPCVRVDEPDQVFAGRRDKERALLEQVQRASAAGQPVLIGTASIAESERLAALFERRGLSYQLLNAKNDAEEAAMIAAAGRPGAITISTNMAGRGTDIKLGGEDPALAEQAAASGGLYVIGTNRHESRRVDDQLRGRAGRQGDPGRTRFLISLEDPIFQRYGLSTRLSARTRRLEPAALVNDHETRREIERTQRIVEGQNHDIRMNLLKYSQLLEQQRLQVQRWRAELLRAGAALDWLDRRDPTLLKRLLASREEAELEPGLRRLLLDQLDDAWAEHLARVDAIREGIHLHSIGGGNPLALKVAPIDTFRGMLQQSLADLAERLERDALEAIQRAVERGDHGLDHTASKRPAATWTYLVNEDPFASLAQNVVSRIKSKLAGRR